jgi:hypothetical protein
MLREVLVAGAVLAGSVAGAQPPPPPPEDESPDSAVVSADELFEAPEVMTEGTNVRLDNVIVRAKTGNILRVRYGKHEIFVVPPDPAKLDWIAVGARIHVQGTLRRPPSAPQARLEYAMRRGDARRLARARFYVDAWSVSATR